MANQKLRVLLDLSMAARGYCGIAQDVRLLYKVLASCPEIELTGLISLPLLRPWHKFLPTAAPRSERLANQASFLGNFEQNAFDWQPFKPLRTFSQLRRFASTVLSPWAHTDPLEVDVFWHSIWRLLFSRTLPAADLPLVKGGNFLLSDLSDGMVKARVLMGRGRLKLDTSGYDFLIVQGPRPLKISRGTRQIIRYHDMIPTLQPDTRPHSADIAWHHKAIRQSLNSFFVCNSQPTRSDLLAAFPDLRDSSAAIPCLISDFFRPEYNPGHARAILDVRRSDASGARPGKAPRALPQYVMCVSTLEPRKNLISLIEAFNAARYRAAVKRAIPNLKLVMVGSPGWKYEPILAAMRPLVARGDIVHLENVTSHELRVLYSHAESLVFPSHAEGFGIPPLEAMRCDTPVIASDIATHRWVLGDAALYCNSYDVDSIADSLERLLASEESPALRAELIGRGREQVKRYSNEHCAQSWLELFQRLTETSGGKHLTLPDRATTQAANAAA
jgi:glycosyltransferase involved in cell wall biosynthesis